MTLHLGYITAGTTLYIPFHTFDSNGASITLTGLAVTDIEIYKNGSTTQRSSDNGYTLLDTDGIDFDSLTGIHGFSVDLSDNSDAGFYAAGSFYWIVVSAVTVDTRTVSFVAATFILGPIAANATQILGTAISTPATAGILDVNVKNIDNDAASASGTVTFPNATIASTTNITAGTVTTATNVTTVNGLAANVITAASINADAITAAKVADGAIDAATFAAGAINAAAIAADAITAAKIADGAIDAATFAAGAINAAAIAADAITDAKVASDVTIASVTGAVGSVTGLTAATVHADLDDIQARLPAALTAGGNIKADALVVSDKTGYSLSSAGIQAIWDALTAALTTVGSIGKLLVDNINATISSRASQTSLDTLDDYVDTEVAAIKSKTDNLPSDPADASDIAASFTTVNTKLDTIDDFIDTEIAAIKAKTDNLPASPAATGDIPSAATIADAVWDEDATAHQTQGTFGQAIGDPAADTDTIWGLVNANLDATITSRASQTSVDTVDDFLDTEIAAILTDTNELQTDWADGGRLDLILDARASQASVDDLPTNAELATSQAAADDATLAQIALVKTETDKIASIKTKTDSLTFTAAGQVDANVQSVNDVALTGDGSGTPWGPA